MFDLNFLAKISVKIRVKYSGDYDARDYIFNNHLYVVERLKTPY